MATARAKATEEHKPSFQVLERTFSILDLFDEDRPEWSTTEVARALALPIPTAHRILVALRRHGFVTQHEDTKRFRLGIAALQLGDRARAVVDLRSVALPALRRLAQDTGETSLLTVPSSNRDRAVCIERVETAQPLRLSLQPGRQLPLHAGASQKALLAFMRDGDVETVIAGGLEHLCASTITDPRLLREELATVRRRGWAGSYEETNLGVWGVAVPVLNGRGDVVCAVGIAGPSARLGPERVREDIERVHDAAGQIARALGLTVPSVSATKTSITPRRGRQRSQNTGQRNGRKRA